MDSVVVPSFEDFVGRNRRKLDYFAARFGLEHAEVENTAYLAWSEAARKFDPGHVSNAGFGTFALSTLENMLQAESNRLLTVAISDPESAEGDAVGHSAGLENLAIDHLSGDGVLHVGVSSDCYSAHASPIEDQLEELLCRTYADLAFGDVLRAHPAYGNPTYRLIINGVVAGETAETIALHAQCTPRRIYQAISELLRIIRRRDPVLDDRLVRLQGEASLEAEPLRFRHIDSLDFAVPADLDRERVLEVAASMLGIGMIQPIVIDQFSRVIKGVKRLIAARLIDMRVVKTLVRPVAEGVESRTGEALARLKDAANMRASTPLKLVPALLKWHSDGRLSTLVATRLAALPEHDQHAIVKCLSITLQNLSIHEANALVQAHEHGCLWQVAKRLRVTADRKRPRTEAEGN